MPVAKISMSQAFKEKWLLFNSAAVAMLWGVRYFCGDNMKNKMKTLQKKEEEIYLRWEFETDPCDRHQFKSSFKPSLYLMNLMPHSLLVQQLIGRLVCGGLNTWLDIFDINHISARNFGTFCIILSKRRRMSVCVCIWRGRQIPMEKHIISICVNGVRPRSFELIKIFNHSQYQTQFCNSPNRHYSQNGKIVWIEIPQIPTNISYYGIQIHKYQCK